MVNINFKNTEEAINYGKKIKGNEEQIADLQDLRNYYKGQVSLLMVKGKEAEALYLASGQSQFANEALEEAERI